MQNNQTGSGKITAISMVVIIGLSIVGVITALSGIGVEKAVTVKPMEVADTIAVRTMSIPDNISDDVAGGFHQVPVEVRELASVNTLVDKAQQYQQLQQPIKALYLLEVALAAAPANQSALETRLAVLQYLLKQASEGAGNNYEKDYLRQRIAVTEQALAQ